MHAPSVLSFEAAAVQHRKGAAQRKVQPWSGSTMKCRGSFLSSIAGLCMWIKRLIEALKGHQQNPKFITSCQSWSVFGVREILNEFTAFHCLSIEFFRVLHTAMPSHAKNIEMGHASHIQMHNTMATTWNDIAISTEEPSNLVYVCVWERFLSSQCLPTCFP